MNDKQAKCATPERVGVRPAVGHLHHAKLCRDANLTTTADFIEAQDAEIAYLYAALQIVRDRARRAGIRNKVAHGIRGAADFALQYGV